MSCAEASEWMGAVADREVDGRRARRVLAHVESCPGCYARFQRLADWKRLAASAGCSCACASLRSRVRGRLAEAALRDDDGSAWGTPTRPWAARLRDLLPAVPAWELGAVAGLLVGVALAGVPDLQPARHLHAASHAQAQAELPSLAADALEPDAAMRAWLHLAGCPSCFQAYRALWRQSHPAGAGSPIRPAVAR